MKGDCPCGGRQRLSGDSGLYLSDCRSVYCAESWGGYSLCHVESEDFYGGRNIKGFRKRERQTKEILRKRERQTQEMIEKRREKSDDS